MLAPCLAQLEANGKLWKELAKKELEEENAAKAVAVAKPAEAHGDSVGDGDGASKL